MNAKITAINSNILFSGELSTKFAKYTIVNIQANMRKFSILIFI